MKAIEYRLPALGWVFMAALTIVLAGVAFTGAVNLLVFDQQRIGQVVLLTLVALVCVARPALAAQTLQALPVAARAGLALFFTLGLLSVFQSTLWPWAALEWATFLLLLALVLVLAQAWVAAAPSANRSLSWLLAGVALVVWVQVLGGYVAALMQDIALDTIILFDAAFFNRRFFGQLATLLIPLLAWQAWQAQRYRALWWCLLVAWWMLVLVSGTRGSWLALGLALLLLAVLLRGRAWPYVRIHLAAVALGAVAYWLLFFAIPGWLGREVVIENRFHQNFTHLSGREVIWSLAWQHIQAQPWLGIGPMHFAAVPNGVGAHPHNAVLQLAAEWGVPATLLAMSLVVWGLWAFARPLWREVDPLRLALLAALLGAAVQSMVDGVIVIPYTQTWLALIMAWALGLHLAGRANPASPPPGWAAQAGVRALLLGALAVLLWVAEPEICNRAAATAAGLEQYGRLVPRYWAQGWIGQ